MKQANQIEKIRVWERGQITLPKNLRKEMNIKENDILSVEKLGKGVYLRPLPSAIAEIQKGISALMKKRGLKVNDLIKDLEFIDSLLSQVALNRKTQMQVIAAMQRLQAALTMSDGKMKITEEREKV